MKRRMNAMVIGVLALASCGDDGSNDPRQSARDDRMRHAAELRRDHAEAIARAEERETAELAKLVDVLIAEQDKIFAEMVRAEAALAAARSEAERTAALAKITELRARRKMAQERLDKVKAGVKLECPPDQPRC